MAFHIGQEKCIAIVIKGLDCIIVATDDVVRHVKCGKLQAGVIRQLVRQALGLDAFGALKIHQHGRYITKAFNTADHFAGCAIKRGGRHLHGNSAAVFAPGENDDGCRGGDPGNHGPMQGAMFFAAQAVPVLILMAKDVLVTCAPHDIL